MPEVTLFRVGDVELSGFDAPEVIGDLGGKQLIAFHRFPGGVISAQLFGRYPEEITFSQTIDGAQARSKVNALDQLVDQGPVVLQYGGWNFLGLVEHVRIDSQHEDSLKYTVTFKPVQRDSQNAGAGSLSGQDLLQSALNMAQQQVAAPSSNYQFSPTLQSQVQGLQASANSTLNGFQNNLFNVPLGSIQSLKSQVKTLQSGLSNLLNNTDTKAASAAADLLNTLRHVEIALDQTVPAQIELNVMNPNLFELAATYYLDPSKWDLIAKANPDVRFDPQPVGNFKLIIPEDPGRTLAQPLTFLQ